MKTKLKIKATVFVDWYFNKCSDQEQKEIKLHFGNEVIESLLRNERYTITPQKLLDMTNQDVIPVQIIEGFLESDGDIELGDLNIDNYEIQLI